MMDDADKWKFSQQQRKHDGQDHEATMLGVTKCHLEVNVAKNRPLQQRQTSYCA